MRRQLAQLARLLGAMALEAIDNYGRQLTLAARDRDDE